MPVTYAALGNHLIGKMPHLAHFTFKDGNLQTVVMADMYMQRRNGQVMMVMLRGDQSACQLALFMFIDIGKHRVTALFGPLRMLMHQRIAQDIAHRLRTVVVPALGAQRVQGRQKIVSTRQGYALQGRVSMARDGGKAGRTAR